ncbi:hypothetical protein DPMN_127474 [Dreissena polymorpha]|uniref:G-protein coupled receptors family 1 profile domain-containing protein n=1 Tax=Dreissena polymorpha TaxID=45954 RepID=A0A9D4GXV0_DREPO|nr:hypothetical protein DPMN_127474 [Dreissena polymorpha]
MNIYNASVCVFYHNNFVAIFSFVVAGISLLLLPFSLFAVVSQHLEYSGRWCQAQGFLFNVFVVTQQFALLTISLDRNYAIMNSLRYPNVFTQPLCVTFIAASWVLAIIVSIPPLVDSGLGRYAFHRNHFLCSIDFDISSGYTLVFCIIVFALPIFLQGVCYIRIFLAAVGHTKRSAKVAPLVAQRSHVSVEPESSTTSTVSTEVHSHSIECKAVRTIFIIAIAFMICWVPYFVEIIKSMNGEKINPNFSAASICFLFAAGILNPLIYAYMNRVTRREIGRFVCGSSMSQDSEDFASTSMSTHTSTWGTQPKVRSKSIATNNDMCTIHEVPEESVFPREVDRRPPAGTSSSHLCSPGQQSFSSTDHFVVETGNATAINSTEIVMETENTASGSYDGAGPSTEGTALHSGQSYWKIINSERFKEQRRQTLPKENDGPSYFSVRGRRRKRDCGSFLYFENGGGKSKRNQVQSISVRVPNIQLRLSVKETDLDKIHKLSVRSNFEYERKDRSRSLQQASQNVGMHARAARMQQASTNPSSYRGSVSGPDVTETQTPGEYERGNRLINIASMKSVLTKSFENLSRIDTLVDQPYDGGRCKSEPCALNRVMKG